MRQLIYLTKWYFNARFRGIQRPLQSVLFISNKCNLACKHCVVYNNTSPITMRFEQVQEELRYCRQQGARFIDLEGGEPFLWRDGELAINDLVDEAKRTGFYSVTVTTNGQLPFEGCRADSMWVSVDGINEYHDEIRGKGTFDRLSQHIAEAKHPNLSVNMVINNRNYVAVRETIKWADANPYIRSISLNFHTPYPGTEGLTLSEEQRSEVIDQIIALKRQGYPIMNSVSGLKMMRRNDFEKHCWVTNFVDADGTRHARCSAYTYDPTSCDRCGLCMAGEMHSVFHFKADTLIAGLKLRLGAQKRPTSR